MNDFIRGFISGLTFFSTDNYQEKVFKTINDINRGNAKLIKTDVNGIYELIYFENGKEEK